MSFRATVIIECALFAAFLVAAGVARWYQPYAERAAYLQGRFDLDHGTALRFALSEGK